MQVLWPFHALPAERCESGAVGGRDTVQSSETLSPWILFNKTKLLPQEHY